MTDARLPRPERAAAMRAARRETILDAAVALAIKDGYRAITRDQIANLAGVAVGSINHEFGTMDALRDAVMAEAVQTETLAIIAQGLADKNPIACGAPVEMREAAVRALA